MTANELRTMRAKRTRAFALLQKRTESDRIVIGGIGDENDTQKRNAYN